jgi:hypothetical protein
MLDVPVPAIYRRSADENRSLAAVCGLASCRLKWK